MTPVYFSAVAVSFHLVFIGILFTGTQIHAPAIPSPGHEFREIDPKMTFLNEVLGPFFPRSHAGLSPEPVLPVLEQAEFIGTGRNRQKT